MEAFSWIGQFIEFLLGFFPRIILVRATHAGVKWKRGWKVRAIGPGIHFYWPLMTEVDIIVVARQTLNLPSQVLTTRDMQRVIVGTVIVYRIRDVVEAIGEKNWDVDTTIRDIAQAAIVDVIVKKEFNELYEKIANGSVTEELTKECRKQLYKFGVSIERCSIIDCADCEVRKLMWDAPQNLASVGVAEHG